MNGGPALNRSSSGESDPALSGDPGVQPRPATDPGFDHTPEPEPETKTETETEPEPDIDSERETDIDTDTGPEREAQPGTRPDPFRPEPRPVTAGGGSLPPRRLLRGTEQLQYLIGKRLLVGVTIRDGAGAIIRRRQFCGPVTEVTDGVVVVEHDGGETLLPAEPDAYEAATPGTYRLASGGEVIDPDYLSTWDVLPGPGEGG